MYKLCTELGLVQFLTRKLISHKVV